MKDLTVRKIAKLVKSKATGLIARKDDLPSTWYRVPNDYDFSPSTKMIEHQKENQEDENYNVMFDKALTLAKTWRGPAKSNRFANAPLLDKAIEQAQSWETLRNLTYSQRIHCMAVRIASDCKKMDHVSVWLEH